MNKLYSLLGIGLLCAATLSSCKEDVIIDGKNKIQEELQTYTAIGSIRGYEAVEKEVSSRANVQDDGRSFMWNTNDKITIWNGTTGYEFATINYDEAEPSNNVEFTGNGNLADGAAVWGIYPKKDSPTVGNIFTFALGDATQSGTKPELQKTMYMLAKGTVNGTMVTNLKFEHLTSLYQFNITNRRPDAYKVTKVVVSCETAIFPTTLTVTGEEKTYSGKAKSITLNLTDLKIAKNGTASGYLSFFPIPDLTDDKELVFTITVEKDGAQEAPETIEKKGKVSELYNAESIVAKDGYKYIAGKKYGVAFNLIEELGYDTTGENQYLVNKEIGLTNLVNEASIMTNPATVITLNTDLDWQDRGAWTPIPEFKGTLDGNGKKISNITIGTIGNSAGLFVTNSGKIQNLTLENVTVNSTSAAVIGGFVATNQGTLQACAIQGGTYTSTVKADVGGLVGKNSVGAALVLDCKVDGTVTFTVTGQSNLGGLVGTNGSWNSPNIKGSFVGTNVKLTINDTSASTAVGGLVGWNCGGIISGSYSLATIQLSKVANAGGLVGASDSGSKVLASYAVGSIITISGCRAGGLVANTGNVTVTGCYSIIALNTLSGSKVGSLIGEWNSSTMNECYYINSGTALIAGAGTISSGGTKVASADDLRDKLGTMNTAISSTGFRYVTSTDNNTPLIIQKTE